jgi:hypothetical protein
VRAGKKRHSFEICTVCPPGVPRLGSKDAVTKLGAS